MSNESKEHEIWNAMVDLWRMLKEAKPEERSETARRYAVTLTELEKVMGYYNAFVMQAPGLIQDGTE